MHIEFIVEEPSMEEALMNIAPKIIGLSHTFLIHNLGGKDTLLIKLPGRLRGYRQWIPDDWRIVVIIDEDRDDCIKLKEELEQIAFDAGFPTKTNPAAISPFKVMNRIAIEELEAWFFGDIVALSKAYPKIPLTLGNNSKYRDPDAIAGGTWEALEKVLQSRGYHRGGLLKIQAARDISQHMDPFANRSRSFQVFRDGLRCIVESE